MSKDLESKNELFSDIKSLIDSAKQKVATEVNSTMSALYWEIGNRINQDLLKKERAEYGGSLYLLGVLQEPHDR